MRRKAKPVYEITNDRKLNAEEVVTIRALYIPRSPRYGALALASFYKVSATTIERAAARETYREIHPRTLPTAYTGDEYSDDGWAYECSIALPEEPEEQGFYRALNKTDYKTAQVEIRRGWSHARDCNTERGADHRGKTYVTHTDGYQPRKVWLTPEQEARRRTNQGESQRKSRHGYRYVPREVREKLWAECEGDSARYFARLQVVAGDTECEEQDGKPG
ncbi:hypothetical protein CA603_46805 [Paraburkholderia hospita]|nr:hypothetical protein CA603_46805 [Paraburkholderia hospita]